MTSSHAVELASQITQDPTAAVPLLRLLHAFAASRGDPLAEAMTRDVMLHVYTRIEHCENSMLEFLSEESNPAQIAA